MAVTVTNIREGQAPGFTSGSSASFAENGTGAVYTAVATPDVTWASIGYSISGGADSAKFSIDSSSGAVRFVSSPDFEAPTDAGSNNVYDLVITATEVGNTVTATRSVAVTVTNISEGQAPGFTSGGSASFAENGTGAVYTAVATPDVTGASIGYSISGGADSAKFSINGSGAVSFISSPDFEAPTDAGSNNVYDLVITATEAGNAVTATRSVAVTVTNISEGQAPGFTSGGSASFAENGTGAVYTAVATPDVTGASIGYSISGGADSAKFSINGSGVVSFISSPDFEAPTDAGSNNVYDLVITATEAGNAVTATRSVAVTVTNISEGQAPGFTSGGSASFAENGTGAVYTAVATPDVTGVSIGYSISGGADSAQFSINSSSGVVSFKNSPDFETPTDAGGGNVYDLVITATEAGNAVTATRSVAVTVTDVDDTAPVVKLGSTVQLEANGTTSNKDETPQITAVGTTGDYVVVWKGQNSGTATDNSIFVQQFVASGAKFGTALQLDGSSSVSLPDTAPQVTSVGTSGESVVVWQGNSNRILVQKLDASGAKIGPAVQLDTTDRSPGFDTLPQVSSVGTGGEFVVVWKGFSSAFKLYVQKFEATGTPSGSAVALGTGVDNDPLQITAVGTGGEYVVAWRAGSASTANIFVQKFHANGSTSGNAVQLQATGVSNGEDISPQITAVGTAGEFVVTWSGVDSANDASIFVQKFHANGSTSGNAVQLEATGKTDGKDEAPQITAVGTAGEFVVVWSGVDSANDASIFVQKFAADGTIVANSAVQLEATGKTDGADETPQITAVGTAGEFVVVWSGVDSGGDASIFVQKFHANGSTSGNAVQLEATGKTDGKDEAPQVTAVGTAGEFVVTWSGVDSGGDASIFVQKFAADGSLATASVVASGATERDNIRLPVQSNELGKAFLVKNDINLSAGIATALTQANETQWNEVSVTTINADMNLSASGLVKGTYDLYAVDAAGNLSLPIRAVLTVGFPPIFSSASSASFAENGTGAAYTAAATPDVAGASISYRISGADSAQFSINSSSGVLGFKSSPDFESPTDSGTNNVYDLVIVAVEAGNTFVATKAVAVTVSNVSDAPTFTSGSIASFVENGTGAVYTAQVRGESGASATYSISGGADSARFTINSSSGVVGFVSSPNHESPTDVGGNNVYDLVIAATTTANSQVATRSVAVTVTDVGDVAPLFTSGTSVTFVENGTGAAYTALATPDVMGGSVSYSISGGSDSAQFSINSSGVVSFVSSPNFEAATDVGGNNVYDIIIRATEANNTHTVTQSVAVTVTNASDAPTFTSGSSATFAENATGAVYVAQVTGEAGATATYSISGGADSARFTINSSSGVVGFVSSPNHESPTDAGGDNIYDLVISASSTANTATATHSVAVTVTDVGDVTPTFTSGSSATIAENATGAVYTALATPDVMGASVGYSISGGADSAKFSINGSGVVSFISSPDFEAPTATGGGNIYDLVISATENGNTFIATRSVAVTVTNASDAPTFTSGSSATFAENATGAVYVAQVTGEAGATATYSISGGADSARFTINSSSGVVGFVSSPNHESPTDADSNNDYDLDIAATTTANSQVATRSVKVTVTDVGDVAPLFTSGNSVTFAENGTGVVYTAVATPDVMGASVSYSISGGADSAQFNIDGSSGVLKFNTRPDYEAPTDVGGDRTYDLIIKATENGSTHIATRSVAVTVTDTADTGPSFISARNLTINENSTGPFNTVQALAIVAGNSVSYAITSGDDSARFTINSSSGALSFVSSPNFEAPTDIGSNNIYDLVVSATEVSNPNIATRRLTVTVNNLAEAAPTFTSGSSSTRAENRSTGAVYTAVASPDVTGKSISYSISGGADSAQFSINSSSGAVSFKSSPNFEQPTDSGGNNVYDITIRATEADNTFIATRSVAVTVTDVDDIAPIVKLSETVSVKLDPIDRTNGKDAEPQIAAVGTSGEFVVTWSGVDSGGDSSIFVQKFAANGKTNGNTLHQLEPIDNNLELNITMDDDGRPQVTQVGTAGDYVVAWSGAITMGSTDYSVFVQKFSANDEKIGGLIKLNGTSIRQGFGGPQVVSQGTGGEFIVTWADTDNSSADLSIFVQRFDANGSTSGTAVLLEADVTNSSDQKPQITTVGTAGDFVVTWEGFDSSGDSSVFVQKFNANGTKSNSVVKLEATGNSTGFDAVPQVSQVGTGGEFVVVWQGANTRPDGSIYVQRFDANGLTAGSALQLDGGDLILSPDVAPQVSQVGTEGEFVVVWSGVDFASRSRLCVQKFSANGEVNGIQMRLPGFTSLDLKGVNPQITKLGTAGEFVVTWEGHDAGADLSIFVQKFSANGSTLGSVQQLEATGKTDGNDITPQVIAVGTTGEFVVTWSGQDSAADTSSVFVQKFTAEGGLAFTPVVISGATARDSSFVQVQSNELGNAYLVRNDISLSAGIEATLTAANETQWNEIAVHAINTSIDLSSAGLISGIYDLYAVDAAGNLSLPVRGVLTVGIPPTFTSGSATSYVENGIVSAYTAQATATTGGSITYSISGGADSAKFTINSGSGVVRFVSSPDFENKTDADSNNIYILEISATEASNTFVSTRSVAVTVTDVDDTAPIVKASTVLQLEAFEQSGGDDINPQLIALGTADQFVVVWSGVDSAGDSSIFLQRFDANGTPAGNSVQLEATGKTDGDDETPQLTTVGTNGEFVVVWSGVDSAGDSSIFVQKFSSVGIKIGAAVQLEAKDKTDGDDLTPQIAALGTAGEFVVTWSGVDSEGDQSIFVQKFDANGDTSGSTTKLEATGKTDGKDETPQVIATSNGEFVVAWVGVDSGMGGDRSIFVQRFDANGGTSGNAVQLEAPGNTMGDDFAVDLRPLAGFGYSVYWKGTTSSSETKRLLQIFSFDGNALGTPFDYGLIDNSDATPTIPELISLDSTNIVVWTGTNPDGSTSILVQYQEGNGTPLSALVQLNAPGFANGIDKTPQIISVGAGAGSVVAWSGQDSSNPSDYSIFVQKFVNTDLQPQTLTVSSILQLANTVLSVDSNETGQAFLVRNDINLSAGFAAALANANENLWNQVAITSLTGGTALFTAGLDTGTYDLYAVDAAGNVSAPVRGVVTIVPFVLQFYSATSVLYAEHGTGAVYTALATSNGDTIIYSISGGVDSARFTIDSSSGVTRFVNSPDHEAPTDVQGSDNVYDLIIRASETGSSIVGTRSVTVTVIDVGDLAPVFTSASSTTVAENATGAVYTAVATPDVTGAVVSYRISGGADSARFSINSSSGVVGFVNSPDFEIPTDVGGDNVYDLIIRASEANNTFVATRSVVVTVSNVVDAPTFTSGAGSIQYRENGTGAVYTAHATGGVGINVSYSISDGADSARFTIDSSSGVVSFVSSPDFETKADSDGDNVYDLVVQATASGNPQVASRSLAVAVTDADEIAPLIRLNSNSAVDLFGNNLNRLAERPQISAIGSGGEYVVVWSSLNEGVWAQKFYAFGLKQGTPLLFNQIGTDVAEDAQVVALGTGGKFVVTWSAQERTAGADRSIYVQSVSADGTLFGSQVLLEVSGVTNGIDASPQVTAVGTSGEFVVVWQGQESSSGDDSIFVQKFNASGATSGNAVKLEATGNATGADQSPQVTALGTSGEFVVVWSGIDSAGGDASIFVQKFNASGAAGNAVQLEAAGVSNGKDETPQVTAAGTSGEFVVVWSGVDAQGDSTIFVQKFNASGGASGGATALETSSVTQGNDTSPQVTAVGTSGEFVVVWSGIDDQGDGSIFVQKFNANGVTSGSAIQLEASSVTNGTDTSPQVTAVGTTGEFVVVWSGQEDSSATRDYSIFVQKFNASGVTSGSVIQLEAIGYTRGTDQAPQVTAQNLGSSGEFVVTWAGEGPESLSRLDRRIYVQKFSADGRPAGLAVNQITDQDALNLSVQSTELGTAYLVKNDINISAGVAALTADNEAQWNQVAVTAINTNMNLPAAGLVNGTYDLYAVDAAGNWSLPFRAALVVSNYEPSFTSGSSTTFAENGTGAVYTAMAVPNVPGRSVTYNISSGADSAKFSINSSSGVVGFVSSPDFETPADANSNNIYNLVITASESGNTFVAFRSVAVTVSDVADVAPAFSSASSTTFVENGTGAVYTAVAVSDVSGAAVSYSISGGADSAKFTINSSSGAVSFVSSPDFENKTDADSNNIYILDIRATEAGNAFVATRTVAVTVTDVDETAPKVKLFSSVKLEPTVQSAGDDKEPQVTKIGTGGEFVVSWSGNDNFSDSSIFVQKFLANGKPSGSQVQLDGVSNEGPSVGTDKFDQTPQVTSVGTSGEYVVVWQAIDSNLVDFSIFVQKFTASGTIVANTVVQLEATGKAAGDDKAPQVTAVGTGGEFVVVWQGDDTDSPSDISIFVKKFDANGAAVAGNAVQLEAKNASNEHDVAPQIAAVGTAGEFVVVWQGQDSDSDNSIFVQKFTASGTIVANTVVQLEATGKTDGDDKAPQVTAVGTSGEFVVVWQGKDSDASSDYSIFVKKFDANGAAVAGNAVQLEATGNAAGSDESPQVTAVGSGGEFVVVWSGVDTTSDYSIFVQKFAADGTASGNAVQLEAIDKTNGNDLAPQVTKVGTAGEFVVVWAGVDSASASATADFSIFVQKFAADGTKHGSTVQLEAAGFSGVGEDETPQVTEVGTSGAFVVTWAGVDTASGDYSIFVQQFKADGSLAPVEVSNSAERASTVLSVQSNEVGKAYLVKNDLDLSAGIAALTAANETQWNEVAVTANTDVNLPAAGLVNGNYDLYAVDAAGNWSMPIRSVLTVMGV